MWGGTPTAAAVSATYPRLRPDDADAATQFSDRDDHIKVNRSTTSVIRDGIDHTRIRRLDLQLYLGTVRTLHDGIGIRLNPLGIDHDQTRLILDL